MSVKSHSTIPDVYPGGGPLYWGDEESGELVAAVRDFYRHIACGHVIPPTDKINLVRDYLIYYINAPCWDWNPHHTEQSRELLAEMRQRAKELHTPREIAVWLEECLDMGHDPL